MMVFFTVLDVIMSALKVVGVSVGTSVKPLAKSKMWQVKVKNTIDHKMEVMH